MTQTSFAKIKSGWCARRNSINKRKKSKESTREREKRRIGGGSTINPLRFSPPVRSLSPSFGRFISALPSTGFGLPFSFRSRIPRPPSGGKTTLSLLFTTSSYRRAAPYYSSYVNEFRLIIWERSHTENENGGNVGVRGLAPKRGWRCFRYTVKDYPWIHCDGTLPALENFSSPISFSLSPALFLSFLLSLSRFLRSTFFVPLLSLLPSFLSLPATLAHKRHPSLCRPVLFISRCLAAPWHSYYTGFVF